jgi:hypothetical protein
VASPESGFRKEQLWQGLQCERVRSELSLRNPIDAAPDYEIDTVANSFKCFEAVSRIK